MRLLVTGAGGMLGRDVVSAATTAEHEAVAMPRAELDITDEEAVRQAVAQSAPEVVVNCAAYTDVDGAETDEETALAVNAAGAGNTARAATEAGARMVHVSTDYVFDGLKPEFYVETDTVNPLSAYGRTKLAGEEAVAANAQNHAIVRSSWLFGTGGRNFVATMLGLAADRDEVSVVTDQIGCPTFTGHLAGALLELAGSEAVGVFHVAGGGACSWNDFARETFVQAGIECTVKPATTEEMARPAPRPASAIIRTGRTDSPELPPWQVGLAAYLEERAALEAASA